MHRIVQRAPDGDGLQVGMQSSLYESNFSDGSKRSDFKMRQSEGQLSFILKCVLVTRNFLRFDELASISHSIQPGVCKSDRGKNEISSFMIFLSTLEIDR